MAFLREEKVGSSLLKIEGAMTINEATALCDELTECLKSCNSLIIDLNGVTECDVAAIQLLCSARLTARSAGKGFSVAGASMSSIDAIARAGLDPDTILGSANME